MKHFHQVLGCAVQFTVAPPQHFLYFFPEPHGHGSFRPIFGVLRRGSLVCALALRSYNKRGTAEQWIKEGKQAVKMTRLSCHRFRSNQVRLALSLLACNLAVIFSAWPGVRIHNPHGHRIAWMQDGTEYRVPKDAVRCPGNCEECGICFRLPKLGRDVVFHKH